ncbi:MAG: PTS sugar transporter subunit IIC [Clostridia bacterium]
MSHTTNEQASTENKKTSANRVVAVIKKLSKRWFIDGFTGMALGLFATVVAGTILAQIGRLIEGIDSETAVKIGSFIQNVANVAQVLLGAGIGAGVAYALKADKLTIFTCVVAGMLGANGSGFNPIVIKVGNPLSAFVTALITCEICMLIAGKTKVDIVIIPLVGMIIAAICVLTICEPINYLIRLLASGLSAAIVWSPLLTGIIISVVMGLILTLPISSAAIWMSIAGVNPSAPILLAGGASAVGCAAHMIGFAIASFRENKVSGLIAQGLGTSMLQIPNIMKNPKILIPQIVSSAVVGGLSTTVFKLKCDGTGGGMGTSGLVGVIQTYFNSGDLEPWVLITGIVLLFFVLPALISFGVSELLRKIGWIKPGDQKLPL